MRAPRGAPLMTAPSAAGGGGSGAAAARALRAGRQLLLLLAACVGAFAALHSLGAFHVAPHGGSPEAPLLTLGVLSDAHYADVADALSAWGVRRHYRASLDVVRQAVADWARVPTSDGGVAAVVHLGDAVDGKARGAPGGAAAAFDAVTGALGALGRPVYYLLGNHAFYSAARPELLRRYNIPTAAAAAMPSTSTSEEALGVLSAGGNGSAYFAVRPAKGVRLLFLDSYAESTIGWPEGDARREGAQALLSAHNPAPPGNGQKDPGKLKGAQRRWVSLGGALGGRQLAWLDAQLADAAALRERALVFSHVPLHPGATSAWCGGMCLAWDYDAALAVLRSHGATVGACFAGHDHSGGGATDRASGIHFVTLQGIIETPQGRVSYGQVVLTRTRLLLRGEGRMASRDLALRPLPAPAAAGAAADAAARGGARGGSGGAAAAA
jgi:manganese-dependent ADP-ribose/CDP-alcohol diphosphatase